MKIIIDIGLNNLLNTCGNVGIWRKIGAMLAQLLAENVGI
jgi:hypothetical protein